MTDYSANNKRIAKNTIFLYLRQLITMAVSLYTVRVILDVLGAEDYGIYNVIGGIVSLFSFLSSTMASASRYPPMYGCRRRLSDGSVHSG